MNELNPCPFCGSDQVGIEFNVYGYPYAICWDCHASSCCADLKGTDGIKEVVKAWNRRADE